MGESASGERRGAAEAATRQGNEGTGRVGRDQGGWAGPAWGRSAGGARPRGGMGSDRGCLGPGRRTDRATRARRREAHRWAPPGMGEGAGRAPRRSATGGKLPPLGRMVAGEAAAPRAAASRRDERRRDRSSRGSGEASSPLGPLGRGRSPANRQGARWWAPVGQRSSPRREPARTGRFARGRPSRPGTVGWPTPGTPPRGGAAGRAAPRSGRSLRGCPALPSSERRRRPPGVGPARNEGSGAAGTGRPRRR